MIDNTSILWYNKVTMGKKPLVKPGTTIRIKSATKKELERIRHKGQSWDGVITELIEFYAKSEK